MQTMYDEGVKDELIVMEMTQRHFGGTTIKATKFEDTKRHIDFWWYNDDGRPYGIDVKGMKKNNRSDKQYDTSIHWVELQNVRGETGWVYGDAVYIAFIVADSVLFVPRKRLATFVEDKIIGKPVVTINPRECYIPYQRAGRLDKIVKVPTSDLIGLAQHILPRQ